MMNMDFGKVSAVCRHGLAVVVVLALGLASCRDDQDCSTLYTRDLKVAFYKVDVPQGGEPDTVALQVFLDSVYVKNHEDTAFYKGKLTKDITVPVHEGFKELTYVIVNKSKKYELKVGYDLRQSFISDFCGMEFIFEKLRVVSDDFQFTDVISDELKLTNPVNIRVIDDNLNPSQGSN